MQTFFTNTYASKFIKALLYNTPVPLYNSVRSGDYLVEGYNYIYGLNVIKCLKSGYINGIEIATPTDAEIHWNRTDIPGDATWVGGTFGNNAFVVISDSNKIARSLDGVIWRNEPIELSLDDTDKINSITFGNNKFLIITKLGHIYESADGIDWIKSELIISDGESKLADDAKKIYYADGIYVVVYDNLNNYYTSTNGINWNVNGFSIDFKVSDIIFGDGKFIAVSEDSNAALIGRINSGEITWNTITLPTALKWSSLAFGYMGKEKTVDINPMFIAVAGGDYYDVDSYTDEYIYSENGITWTLGKLPYSGNWHKASYADGLFTIASDSYILNSVTGKPYIDDEATVKKSSWKSTKFPAYFTDAVSAVLFGSDRFTLDKSIETYQLVDAPSSIWSDVLFGNGAFLSINSMNGISACGKKAVIAYEYSISKYAKYRTVAHYDFGYEYSKFTEKFVSKYNYYDTDTHEHLGDFLRLYRGQFNINLMPFYNCFSGRYIPDIKLGMGGIESETDKNYKVAQIPIKFNKTYTIAIDCPSEVFIMPAFIKNSEIMSVSRVLSNGKTENLNPTKILTDEKNIYSYSMLSFTSPVTVNIPNTDDVFYGKNETNMYKKLQNYEKDLYLLIQLPTENDSSIVVLEGDYTDTHYRRIFDINNYEDFDENIMDDLMLYNLRFLQFSDKVRHPFTPKLIEYLLLNVINREEDIIGNIKRVQNTIQQFTDKKSYGIWQDRMRPIVYNLFMNSEDNTVWDVNGFVDRNMELFLDKWRRS